MTFSLLFSLYIAPVLLATTLVIIFVLRTASDYTWFNQCSIHAI